MRYDAVWAYEYEQIRQYFEELGLTRAASQSTRCGEAGADILREELSGAGCSVVITSLPNRIIGDLSLPQTRVAIEGETAEQIYHGFRLHFLSGGA